MQQLTTYKFPKSHVFFQPIKKNLAEAKCPQKGASQHILGSKIQYHKINCLSSKIRGKTLLVELYEALDLGRIMPTSL